MARQGRCAECRAALPYRSGDPLDAYRLCLACAAALDDDDYVTRSDRLLSRPWTPDDTDALVTAAKAFLRAVPPDARWRVERIALIDAIDRTRRNGPKRNG